MSGDAHDDLPPRHGAWTAEEGTAVAVDVSADRRDRVIWLAFTGGPLVWFLHFMAVYAVVEAGCSGEGEGLRLLDPPPPEITTLAATGLAALACLALALWAYRRWRALDARPGGSDPARSLAFAGVLLSLLSFFAVLLVGLPALVLPSC